MKENNIEKNKYENVIANYTDTQLVYAKAVLDEKKAKLNYEEKALKEEFKKRLRERKD